MAIPCGQCIGCRIDRSRQWAVRCVHEAQGHESNSFITLTYAPEHMPIDGSLVPRHHQLFMKRLRKEIAPTRIKFYHCGEYGEKLSRPHYHTLIFGYDFPDRYPWTRNNGETYFRSDTLEKLWPLGHSLIGNVTFESAAYVARYCMKKRTGKQAYEHYTKELDDGTQVIVEPEYARMSLNPAVGKEWAEQYALSDCYDSGDFIVLNGRKFKPPRYYDQLLKASDPERLEQIKNSRVEALQKHEKNNTPERLAVRERIQEVKAERLKRGYEYDQ